MKLLILISIFFSLSSIAGVGDSSGGSSNGKVSLNSDWKEIQTIVKKDHRLKIEGASHFLGRIVSVFDVCTKGDNFKSLKKHSIKERKFVGRSRDTDNQKDGYMFVEKEKRILEYPIHAIQKKRQCNHHGKQCEFVPVDFIQDTQKSLKVKKFLRLEGSNDRKVYKTILNKKYNIPECSK
jgi:hypothetical protein